MRPLILGIAVAAWAATLYAATQLHQYDLNLSHDICGPWGCAAAPEALAGYHLLWLSLVAPVVVIACRMAGPSRGRRIGTGTLVAGVAGAVVVVVGAMVVWLVGERPPQYALQRGLFVLVTTPDAPLLPLALGGFAGLLAAGRRAEPSENQETPPVEADPASGEN